MKFTITKEWLERHLKRADDSLAGAGGTNLEDLEREAQRRAVTPQALANVPSEIGKVVRYLREQKGLSPQDLAQMADVDVSEITALESQTDFSLSPRAAVYLADALGLSRQRFQEQARMRIARAAPASDRDSIPFAANSRTGTSTADDEFETIRALVKALSESTSE